MPQRSRPLPRALKAPVCRGEQGPLDKMPHLLPMPSYAVCEGQCGGQGCSSSFPAESWTRSCPLPHTCLLKPQAQVPRVHCIWRLDL